MTAELEQLFANEEFLKDLPGIAALPQDVFDQILKTIQESSGKLNTAMVPPLRLPGASAHREAFSDAVHFTGIVVNAFSSGDVTTEDIAQRIQQVLPVGSGDRLVQYLRNLESMKDDLKKGMRRHGALVRASRTLTDIEISCSLRLLADRIIRGTIDVDTYHPRIEELIPVVNLELTYHDAVETSSCVFQLTATDVSRLINMLRIAEKQIKAATESVSLRERGII